MVIGIGIDIVQLDRIEKVYNRFGRRFLAHFLGQSELELLPERPSVTWLASRFAAKEAAVKALGSGFQFGITPQMVEVRKEAAGRPVLCLHDAALLYANKLGATRFLISLSHERDYAVAMAILEG